MKIYIPTRGRINNQLTLENLPPELYVEAILVCPQNEVARMKQVHPHATVLAQPDDITTIGKKRQWLVDTCPDDKMVMLDDDLRFAVRRDDDPGLFRKAEPADIIQAFKELEDILSEATPHAGFAVRGMGIGDGARQGGWQEAKRMIYTLGYYLPIARYWAEWGRIRIREDMDITLQLLSMGFPNRVNHTFVTDQKAFMPGGGDKERTVDISNEDAKKLQEFHPEYVSLVEKTYTNSPSRTEVVCQWQKCLRDGLAFRSEWVKNNAVQ